MLATNKARPKSNKHWVLVFFIKNICQATALLHHTSVSLQTHVWVKDWQTKSHGGLSAMAAALGVDVIGRYL